MSHHQQKAATPRRPAAYLRVAARATTAGDMCIERQRHEVLSAAAALGWPEPTVYTDAGTPGGDRPGPHLASLAAAIRAGRHDAVITYDTARISRHAAGLAGFHALCASHGTTLHTVTDGPVTAGILPILASSG
jgi:DNA invertase Pin-like site-specific DNA recombinase